MTNLTLPCWKRWIYIVMITTTAEIRIISRGGGDFIKPNLIRFSRMGIGYMGFTTRNSDVGSSVIGVCQNDRKSSVLACNLFRFVKLSNFLSLSICFVIKKMDRLSASQKVSSRSYKKKKKRGKYETIGWKVLNYLLQPYYNVELSQNIIFKEPKYYLIISIRNSHSLV